MNATFRQLLPIIAMVCILLVAGAGAFGAYRAYGGELAYYFYEQNHKDLAGFDTHAVYLRDAFRAIHKNPNDAQSYVDLGSAKYGIQDYASAENNYLKALERAPYASVVFWNLSHLYIQTKEYGKAEQYAKLAIERIPERSLGYEALGELYSYYIPAKNSELPTLYRDAHIKTGDSVFLLLEGGYYRDHNEPEKAITAYQTWLAKNPNGQNRNAVEEEIKRLE